MGRVLHFSRTGGHAPRETPPSADQARNETEAHGLSAEDADAFARLIGGISRLSEIACLVDDAGMRLPEGPEKAQFQIWRHDIIMHIHAAMVRLERVVTSFQR